MVTKPKAILSTHDGREASPITKASNVLFENGQTAQDILNDRQDTMISPVIENSSSMFKVGQGDNVDYSANVVNGAYESMVLKGKSMVNCIQEPSSQDVVLPYEFEEGQYVTINDTKESGALGVELKGQTLVNLAKVRTYTTTTNIYQSTEDIAIKPSTKYYIYCNFTLTNLDAFSSDSMIFRVDTFNSSSVEKQVGVVSVVRNDISSTSATISQVFTTSNEGAFIRILPRNGYNSDSSNTLTVDNIMVLEYQEGMENWDIPYFEGMASVKMPTLHTVGKNLFDKNNYIETYGTGFYSSTIGIESVATGIGDTNNKWIVLKLPIGETYSVELDKRNTYPSGWSNAVVESDVNTIRTGGTYRTIAYASHNATNVTQQTFTTTKPYVFINVGYGSPYTQNKQEVLDSIMLNVGLNVLTYEPHKTSILSLPEEVVLRSLPNGVCDTFNTRTGVYTQRIGELVLDGSEQGWTLGTSANWYADGDTFGFYFNDFKLAQGTSLYIDKFLSTPSIATNDMEGCYISTQWSWVGVRIYKTKLPSLTVDAFKQWLSQNPITVQYELATPIVTKINLPSTLKSWNTTTHIYSEIPENTLYPILSHSNPTYPVILKPSTKYSIVANSYSNDHTSSAINFNLGGATASTTVGSRVTTITTPSTLSNELLTMSGRGNKLNNVMVIEGEVVGDEPYFEGICDCKSPILSNIGKNLWNDDLVTVGCLGYRANQCSFVRNSKHSFTVTPNNTDSGQTIMCPVFLKANHTYRITCNITGEDTWLQNLVLGDKDLTRFDTTSDFNGGQNIDRLITPSRDVYYVQLNGRFSQTTKPTTFNNVQIEESSSSTTYEPYKTNILSCNGDKIELTEDMFEQGSFTGAAGSSYESLKEINSNRVRTKKLLKLNKDTSYVAKCNEGYLLEIAFYDEEGLYTGTYISWTSSKVFNIDKNCYVAIKFRKSSNSSVTVSDFDKANLQIREVDKTIVLRSLPNGVCDTLNVETGEYVQRIDKVVLVGAEDEKWIYSYSWADTGCMRVRTDSGAFITNNFNSSSLNILTDAFATIPYTQSGQGKIGIALSSTGNLEIVQPKEFWDKYNGADAGQKIKEYLELHPLTVYYELTTPIIKTVDLSGYPFAYENGHVVLSSGSIEQSLTPKVEYSVATNRNGQIRSNQKMVERHQKQLDQLQAIILANLVNSQYNQTLTTLKYELSRV